ncbi:MAG TPA: adenosylmethionine--8-amino-7-oxononanoate transaminase [Marinobacterium sp.]|nr:adenosylmethionine--8-amino-7-oxononanoate transaminase [Marinobacterium sp.]
MSITPEQLQFDRDHIWHPYSSMINPPPMTPVVSASGTRLRLNDGRELIDGMSSWWSAIHGYNNPVLNQTAKDQIDRMSHVMFGGITHEPAIELARKLVRMSPEGLEKVFIADSGSVSVEVAIKMALQYWQSLDKGAKHKLVTLRGGYHGDTFGAMSVCDPVTGMHEIFTGVLPKHHFVPRPHSKFGDPLQTSDSDALESVFEAHAGEIAALVLEPIVQGAGGMYFYSADYLKRARELCDQYDVLLIADEIATGFGRTGKLFACDHANISPDILCVGKALTGGYMTLAATLTTDKIAQTISAGGAGCFMHGPTFMGNPLACAVANASLGIIETGEWKAQVARISEDLSAGLSAAAKLESVAEVRVIGAIGVVERKEPVALSKVQPLFVERGIWVRPFGRNVYLMPPYISSAEDISALTTGIVDVLRVLEEA